MKILICNAGSTSLKFRLFEMPSAEVLAHSKIERVGSKNEGIFHFTRISDGKCAIKEGLNLPTYTHGIELFLGYLLGQEYGVISNCSEIDCVGFKTVLSKGYYGVHELTSDVLRGMEDYLVVAPAHNVPYLEVIHLIEKLIPSARRIGAFETGFHRTIPLVRRLYGVPYDWYEKYGFQRMGYHGASHRFISETVAHHSGGTGKLISCHLGGSCSLCAIDCGQSVDTSFGFSLQTGVIHANRVGDCDPFLIPFLESHGLSREQIVSGMNKNGGLLGLSGLSNDMRDLELAASQGNIRAKLAIDVFCTSIVRYIGMFYAELGGLDHLAFTGGIGENSPMIRQLVCNSIRHLGVELDLKKNKNPSSGLYDLATPASKVKIYCIATNEELVVARQAYEYISYSSTGI